MDEGHPIRQLVGLKHVMSGQENRCPTLPFFQDDIADVLRRNRVQPLGWLVQEQDARPVHQRAGYHQPLLHAFGVTFDPVLLPTGQTHSLEQSHGIEVRDAEQASEQLQIFRGRHLLVEVGQLKADPDLRLHFLRVLGHIQPQQRCPTALGQQLAGQHLNRRRLAGAIRAQEAQDFAFGHLEADVIDGRHIAIGIQQLIGNNRVIAHRISLNRQTQFDRMKAMRMTGSFTVILGNSRNKGHFPEYQPISPAALP